MLESARPYTDKYHIVVVGAPGLNKEDYQPYMSDYEHVEVVFGNTYKLVSTSKLALVTSGTATLETALLGTPEIVFYRMGGQRIARWVFETFFSVPFISLVNLILGRALSSRAYWLRSQCLAYPSRNQHAFRYFKLCKAN